MSKFLLLLLASPSLSFAAAVDVTAVSQEVLDQISSVVSVGASCLGVYWMVQAFGHVREVLGHGTGQSVDISPLVLSAEDVDQDDFWAKYNSGEAVEGVDFVDVKSVDVAGIIASNPAHFDALQAEADALEAAEEAADLRRLSRGF